jgi:phenylpropionate dioxygenase-like ring-hydroxylating dioxygenase large terminal subunit
MFLRNSWYVAAWAKDLERTLLSRTILGEPLVFYRKENGDPVALEDRCAHRHAPLHLGRLVGDDLQCGYHGLTFGCDGVCKSIPSQEMIPAKARVKSYPVVQRNDWIWVWMGEPVLADKDAIPDFSRVADPAFAATGTTNVVKANFELINDNLMDLSHVGNDWHDRNGWQSADEDGAHGKRSARDALGFRLSAAADLCQDWSFLREGPD